MLLKMNTGTLKKLFCAVYIRVNGKIIRQTWVTFFTYCQILEAAHRIGASDMKKHALDLVVGHFVKVIKTVRGGPDETLPWSPRLGVLQKDYQPCHVKNLVTVTPRFDVPLGKIRLN